MGLFSTLGSVLGTAVGGPVGGAIGGALGNAAGGLLGHGKQKQAAQANAAQYQAATDKSLGFYSPYINGGQQAFGNSLNMQSGNFQYKPTDPSYGFRLQEGENALMRQAAATGGAQSGGAQKALTRYGQNFASTEFANDFARNNTLANYGLQAANGSANALFKGADGVSGARTAKGNAQASQWGDIAGAGGDGFFIPNIGSGGGGGTGIDFSNVPPSAFSGGFNFGGGSGAIYDDYGPGSMSGINGGSSLSSYFGF